MTPLPPPRGDGALVFRTLDQARFAPKWDSGEGSDRFGGRWNRRGKMSSRPPRPGPRLRPAA